MDLRQFRYFVEVATNLSFTRAAKRLHISQPTLSQQIRALEHALGAKLFVRNTTGLAMTQAGKIFLERTSTTLREAQAAIDDARAASEGFVGRLNVVCGPMAEYCILQDVLAIAREKPRSCGFVFVFFRSPNRFSKYWEQRRMSGSWAASPHLPILICVTKRCIRKAASS